MKKSYIKPETLVVNLNSFESIMQVSGGDSLTGTSWGGNSQGNATSSDAREVIIQDNIQTPDPWDDEW